MTDTRANKAEAKFFNKLQSDYGEDVVHSASTTPDFDVVSTGSIALDFATGVGGIPRGYIIEVYGKEGVGKTSLAYKMIAEEQKIGGFCVCINLEGRFNKEWAEQLGVDTSRLYVANPVDGEMAADILYKCVNSGVVSLVAFDSVGAMLGSSELEGADRMGGQAKLVTGMVKRVMRTSWAQRCTVVFLNQARDVMNARLPSIESPGGRGLKHAATIRVELKRTEAYKGMVYGEKKEVGYRVSAVLKKNKVASPKRTAQWDFYTDPVDGHTVGIDHNEEIMSLAMNPTINVIQRSGSWYYHPSFPDDGGKNRIKSRDAVQAYLQDNQDSVEQVRRELMEVARGERQNDPLFTEEEAIGEDV